MNHRDKAWVEFKGLPLITHVINCVAPCVDDVIISRNEPNSGYEQWPYRCIADGFDDYQGPLAGVASCIDHVSSELTLVVPCDMPDLPANLVEKLKSRLPDKGLVTVHDGNRLQPLIFLAHTNIAASIKDYLTIGKRSAIGWLETQEHSIVQFNDPAAFANINEPGQLEPQ